MPVPTEELKLEIVHAATGKTLGAAAAPSTDGTLVVRDFPDGGPSPEQWHLAPAQDDQAYVIRDAATGKVLDNPAAADRGIRRADAAAGATGQQWHLLPVEGEADQYVIESAADGSVLDLVAPDEGEGEGEDTRIVLGEYDDSAPGQRWKFVVSAPERTSDLVLRYAPLSHWTRRQSWRLVRAAALRPAADATPSFSDMLLVLDGFGSSQDAGEWKSDGSGHPLGGHLGQWAAAGARFLADTSGAGRADIVGLKPGKGAVTASSRGDGTFDDERALHQGTPSANPADLWSVVDTTGNGQPDLVVLSTGGVRISSREEGGAFTPTGGKLVLKAFGHGPQAGGWQADKHPRFLADTTGSGRLDVVGCHDDGVWISLQDEDGTFAPLGDEPVLKAFGHGEDAGSWLIGQHPRFLADTTGNGRLDIVGCHDDGVWVSQQNEDGTFEEPLFVLDDFGTDQGWKSAEEHPRFLVATTGGEAVDIVGFGPQGVVVSRGRRDGTFEPSKLVLNDYGNAQGWASKKHLRLVADITGDGNPDIVGFGDEGVWVSHNQGEGTFEQAQLVCRGFGYGDAAGAWRVGHHPRFLADITGDGRLDIVGFGGPGVYVARNLHRRFRTR
ncbi:FG-GAP-like repeat-containing protein [Streptomyces sp. NPDC018059]|uniref:FG-GAP-like repeat-containing protein n=1 Tax=Streptomyces sp. NPDC018059 TaxID=3365041 RepID=UPI00379371D6